MQEKKLYQIFCDARGSCIKYDKLCQVTLKLRAEDYKFENERKSECVVLEISENTKPL